MAERAGRESAKGACESGAGVLVVRDARVLTMKPGGVDGAGALRGEKMQELAVLPRGDVVIDRGSGMIVEVRAHDDAARVPSGAEVIEARGRVLMPGFVDCHTHACWAGSRIDEWEMKLSGKSYLEIMAGGGGIMSTVRAVRAEDEGALVDALLGRLEVMLACGTTTVEVKSGYGLDEATELKMLHAILSARERFTGTAVPTALLGHAIDAGHLGGRDAFVRDTVARTLPQALRVLHEGGIEPTVDAFCEQGAWTVEECVRLFEAARTLNPHTRVRVHADQFNSLGMVREAVRLGAVSVDHLEASSEADLVALAQSRTFAVILPCCGFHLDGRFANGRTLVDHGAAVSVASNFNPGSAPCASMGMAIALAVRHCGLTAAEAICATTRNAAALMGFADRGFVAPGARADLVLLRHTDERALAYEFGDNPVETVIVNGRVSK